jgi:hypothetical protein
LGLLLIAAPVVVQAQFYYSINPANGDVTITGYYGPDGGVSLPPMIEGLTVTGIGEDAFYECIGVTNVTIPSSVRSIGDGAFYGSGLGCLTIPGTVTNIGVLAFQNCTSLINVTIGNGVTSIEASAFNGCLALANIAIPGSVTGIGPFAFCSCLSLTNVTIPTGVASIGDAAFSSCYGLASVTIPGTVISIGEDAFDGCVSLTNLTISNGVTSIGNEAFQDCNSLTNVMIPASVASIGANAFRACFGLTAITVDAQNSNYSSVNGVLFDQSKTTIIQFPNGLVGNYTIPTGVASIGQEAFYVCGLASVTIPATVTNIGADAFYACGSLTSLYFTGDAPFYGLNPIYADSLTVYYLPGTTGWSSNFAGLPTALWLLPNPLILNNGRSLGMQSNAFGFTVSWATNISVVVEACTNLSSPVWVPLQTNALTNGSFYFSDLQWTNYPSRFYRISSP